MISLSCWAKQVSIDATNTVPFNILGIQLTKDTLKASIKKFPGAKIINGVSDPEHKHDHEYDRFCVLGKDGVNVKFSGNFYSDDKVGEYVIEKDNRHSDFCAKSAVVSSKLKIPFGLWLGMTKADVEKKLGKSDNPQSSVGIGSVKSKLDLYNYTTKKPKFWHTLSIYIGYGAKNLVDTIYVSFDAEPTG